MSGPQAFGPVPDRPSPAERLDANNGADHVPVRIDISGMRARRDEIDGFVDARVNAERETVAGCVDVLDKARQRAPLEADRMQDRPENLAFQLADGANFKRWCDEGAACAFGGKRRLKQNALLVRRDVGVERRLRLGVDRRVPISVSSLAGSPTRSSAIAPLSMPVTRSAMPF